MTDLESKLKELKKLAHYRRSGEMLELIDALLKCREQRWWWVSEFSAHSPSVKSHIEAAMDKQDAELLAILEVNGRA